MQELRVESTDRAHNPLGLQHHATRMELYQANQLSDHSRREKCWLQVDRMRNLQEIEELKEVCCTEAERAKQ